MPLQSSPHGPDCDGDSHVRRHAAHEVTTVDLDPLAAIKRLPEQPTDLLASGINTPSPTMPNEPLVP